MVGRVLATDQDSINIDLVVGKVLATDQDSINIDLVEGKVLATDQDSINIDLVVGKVLAQMILATDQAQSNASSTLNGALQQHNYVVMPVSLFIKVTSSL